MVGSRKTAPPHSGGPPMSSRRACHQRPWVVHLAVEPTSADHEFLRMITDDPTVPAVAAQGVVAGFVDRRDPSATVIRRVLEPLGRSALRRVTFPSAHSA